MIKECVTTRLVKSEDLNHHGTLFAGRMSEWFVEGCFIAAATLHGNPEEIVCLKLHGMKFSSPAKKGSIIKLITKVVKVGTSSLTVYGKVTENTSDTISVDGFITFVCVDQFGNKKSHNLTLEIPTNEHDLIIYNNALSLK